MPSAFICHASEDKAAIAAPLAEALRERHVDVWYDAFKLKVGDSLREKIDEGLAEADFGIVIVSPAFFTRPWTKRELNGLVAREMAGTRSIVLPVWHEIDHAQVVRHSPPLADVFACNSADGLAAVVEQLLKTIRPVESPLVIARQRLAALGVPTPSVADDWWLDISELKQSHLAAPDTSQRWIFPLPFESERNSHERGANLVSTALQLDWCYDAEDLGLCQITRPDILHDFIRARPGMFETVQQLPGTLAMYAPQLTLPGFDDGLEDAFDALLDPGRRHAYESIGYDGRETVDRQPPTCDELIAWRHPQFGGYTPRFLGYSFVNAHDGRYSRRTHSTFECLAWLLSDDAAWLPERLSSTLIEGIRSRGLWLNDLDDYDNALARGLFDKTRKGFQLTRSVRTATISLFDDAAAALRLETSGALIAERFFERDIVGGWYDEQDAIKAARARWSSKA